MATRKGKDPKDLLITTQEETKPETKTETKPEVKTEVKTEKAIKDDKGNQTD